MTIQFSRRGILGVFAATTVAAAPVMANAFGVLRGAGDYRRVRMYSGRTGESIDTVYWVEGKYIRDALNEINIFMRDWRTGEVIGVDPRTVDVAAASVAGSPAVPGPALSSSTPQAPVATRAATRAPPTTPAMMANSRYRVPMSL